MDIEDTVVPDGKIIMRQLTALVFSGALALFVACGGGDLVQGPTESGEATPLDFSAIAGTWEGEWAATRNDQAGTVEISLSAGAVVRDVVGTAEWTRESGGLLCRVDFIAVSAQPPTYTVRQEVVEENCAEALIHLEHSSASETLSLESEFNGNITATGTLTRQN